MLKQFHFPSTLLAGNIFNGMDVYPSYTSARPNGTYQFTKFACPAGGGFHLDDYSTASYGGLDVQECEFWGGTNVLGGTNGTTLLLDNNLFARSCIGAAGSGSLSFSNNLVWGTASARLNPASGTVWYAYDNAFDSTIIGSSTLTNGYNAYLNCSGHFIPINSSDIFSSSTLAYKSGWLGTFYQPTTSLLINKGGTNADQVGLYEFTTQTNQSKETNSIVDIGYHYVATDAYGNPLDSNGDGIPDYIEDANGDGLVDNGETNWALAILVQPTNQIGIQWSNTTFNVTAGGIAPLHYQWYFNGTNLLGWATSSSLILTNVMSTNAGNYSVVVTNNYGSMTSSVAALTVLIPPTMVVAWGDDSSGQIDVPPGLTNAVDVAGGYNFSLALKADGTVVAWGDNTYGETNVPAGLTNVTAIAAGYAHVLALLRNGTVVAWGADSYGQTNIPAGLTNVTAIAAGDVCSLALRSDGRVVAWGYNYYGQTNVPATLGSATQIDAGSVQSVALLTNGTVAMWANYDFSSPPYVWNITNVPAGLSNVVSIAAGDYHTLAVNSAGTVTAWGAGGTNAGSTFDNYGQSIVPSGLSNVVAVAGGVLFSMALQSDGTVTAWGDDIYGETDVPDRLTGVKAISAGGFHGLAIRSGSFTPLILEEPEDQYAVAGSTVTFYSEGEGVAEVTYQWQFDGVNIAGATGATLTLTNVQSTDEGSYQVVISDSAGFVTSDTATFTLITPPVITSQTPMPTNQVAIFQTNLTLSIAVTAPGQTNGFPLYYQWQLNGTNISEANSNSYSFMADTTTSGNYSVIVTNAAGGTNAVWQVTLTYADSYIDVGTLAYHLSTNAVGRTNGYSGSFNDKFELSGWVYDTYSGTNMAHLTNSVWSTNFWLKGVQGLSATCIGFSNGLGGQGLVTMISPRHCLYASHMHFLPGYFMAAFLDTNNVIYWRTNMQNVVIGNDVSMGILNADLPPSVGFLPVIPTNFSNYLPTNNYSYVQGIGMNQDMSLFSQPMVFPYPVVSWNSSIVAPFGLPINWNIVIRGGDSSDPERLLIGNQLVLASHNSNVQVGPNYAYQIDAINQQMHYLSTNNSVGTDYQLTQFPLTNWPTIH